MSQKLCVLTSYYKILRLISQIGWNEQPNGEYSKMVNVFCQHLNVCISFEYHRNPMLLYKIDNRGRGNRITL